MLYLPVPADGRPACMRSLFSRLDLRLCGILLVASALRWAYPTLYQATWDEVSILYSALRLARHGQWTWLSNYSQWGRLPGHSPLSVYLASIPYLFSGAPWPGRLWIGLLGVTAVGVVYGTMKQYFGQTAALITALLFAVHAPAVDWSRVVWNPNYAQPFLALWLLTGLSGYYAGKRWAQAVHWLALSGAIQAHPGNALLGPLSLLLFAVGWFRPQSANEDSEQSRGLAQSSSGVSRLTQPGGLARPRVRAARGRLIRYTLLGWALFLISLIPWGIGVITADAARAAPAAVNEAADDIIGQKPHYTLGDVAGLIAGLTGSVDRRLHPSMFTGTGPTDAIFSPGHWWPGAWIETIFWTQAGLTLAAALAWLAYGLWKPGSRFPILFLALLSLWPLLGYFISPTSVHVYYLMAMLFGTVPALGLALAKVAEGGAIQKWLVSGLVGAFVVAQAWLTVASIRGQYLAGNLGRFTAPMRTYLSGLDEWVTAGGGREIILLTETQEGKRGPKLHAVYWQVMSEGYRARVVLMDPPQGVPIPPGGALIASTYGGQTIPALFGAGAAFGALPDGEPMYRFALLEAPPSLRLDLTPEASDLFGNSVRILGVSAAGPPRAGGVWLITLVWQTDRTVTDQDYSFSVRLVDDQDRVWGQVDGLALSPWLWAKGDTVLSRFEIPVGSDYPAGSLPRIWLLMYGADNVSVVDEHGNWLAPWMFLGPASDR